jgi:hypothetical protein
MTATEGSRPAVAAPPDIQGFRRSVAVVIGIDAYSGRIPPLKSAANDATHLARLLTEQHHYDEVRLLTNDQASCAALRTLLETELAELVGDDGQSRLTLDWRRQLIDATAIWQELQSKAHNRRQRWQASRRL